MKELLRKIMEKGGSKLDTTEAGIRKAGKKLGYTNAQLDSMFRDFDGFPLDDDDINDIAGGLSVDSKQTMHNRSIDFQY